MFKILLVSLSLGMISITAEARELKALNPSVGLSEIPAMVQQAFDIQVVRMPEQGQPKAAPEDSERSHEIRLVDIVRVNQDSVNLRLGF